MNLENGRSAGPPSAPSTARVPRLLLLADTPLVRFAGVGHAIVAHAIVVGLVTVLPARTLLPGPRRFSLLLVVRSGASLGGFAGLISVAMGGVVVRCHVVLHFVEHAPTLSFALRRGQPPKCIPWRQTLLSDSCMEWTPRLRIVSETHVREPAKCSRCNWFAWDALSVPRFTPLERLRDSGFIPGLPV